MTESSGTSPDKPRAMFALGQIGTTPGVLNTLTELNISPLALIHRHVTGDWGDMGAEDQKQNLLAIPSGRRIFSSYKIGATTKIWIITEADRSSTTLLLPAEYLVRSRSAPERRRDPSPLHSLQHQLCLVLHLEIHPVVLTQDV